MPSVSFEQELGELFTDLHHSGLFADGKEISDSIFHIPPAELLDRYQQAKQAPDFDLYAFFKKYFSVAPQRASNYQSDTSQAVDTHIERLWDVLRRDPDADTYYSSKIPLPKPYIVPGGRFNEIYYWDSYFTMLGLEVSGHYEMIEQMIDNFAYLINTYGFIPNGNRTYFLGRSQPPFFSAMVRLLAKHQGDETLVRYQSSLEKEYQFWMNGKAQLSEGQSHKRVVCLKEGLFVNRYFDNHILPRTEMYMDDVELLEQKGDAGEQLLLDIRAACESGWDFSSRWCADPLRLETTRTTDICPIDLNCLLYHLEQKLMQSYQLSGAIQKSQQYEALAQGRAQWIQSHCWDSKSGYYFDYNHRQQQRSQSVTAAGLFPLFFGIASPEQAASCAALARTQLLKAGGLVTTAIRSGQQWDAPNGWAPLQWIAIKGFRNYGQNELADDIQTRWTNLNRKVYQRTGKLMEKYNVIDLDLESGGGEYPVQDGFGWTNGVLLKLLNSPA